MSGKESGLCSDIQPGSGHMPESTVMWPELWPLGCGLASPRLHRRSGGTNGGRGCWWKVV